MLSSFSPRGRLVQASCPSDARRSCFLQTPRCERDEAALHPARALAHVLLPICFMHREPRISDALERTYEAGQSLIVQRIDLLVAESKLFAQSGALFVAGAAIALLGWIYLVQGVIDGFAERYPRFAVEVAVGFLHVGAAAFLFYRTRSRVHE